MVIYVVFLSIKEKFSLSLFFFFFFFTMKLLKNHCFKLNYLNLFYVNIYYFECISLYLLG
jgi:hypothetical protein